MTHSHRAPAKRVPTNDRQLNLGSANGTNRETWRPAAGFLDVVAHQGDSHGVSTVGLPSDRRLTSRAIEDTASGPTAQKTDCGVTEG